MVKGPIRRSLLLGTLLRGRLLGRRHLLRQHLLHALLLLDQERPDDAAAHARGATRAAIGAAHAAFALLQPPVFDRPQAWKTDQPLAAITTCWPLGLFLDHLVHEAPTRGAEDAHLVVVGVVARVAAVRKTLDHGRCHLPMGPRCR